MTNYFLMSASLGVLLAVVIFWFIRKDHMHVQYSIWWIVVAAFAILFGLFPNIIDYLGPLLGVDYPPALLFLWAIVGLLLKAFLGDIERSRTKRRLLRLTQRLVILEEEMRRLERQNSRASKPSAAADDKETS
jgi:hypothetical protein